ncbi:MAG: lipid-A-disaccharide synthase [Planctomycetaceae bacterium]|nr:lipid-A-disaccharide synthase [Planctomycetaceae bacterium]MBQ2822813.1 lipid-A-disaccharide synthase [Thermoguttaceae bacterium]
MKVFFSAGEPSGDVHGANLIHALRKLDPEIQCVGFGGPKMSAAGLKQHFDLTSLAVMWLGEAIVNLRKFFVLADEAEEYFREEKPAAVILIDYPGFNWHIAKRAKKYGIPVFYYSPPQVWGWLQGRVKKLKKRTDIVFSGLPFEAQWLRKHGCRVELVGHPFFDEIKNYPQNTDLIKYLNSLQPLVGLLPGSRTGEVRRNFPVFWKTALKIQREMPCVHFAVAAFRKSHADWIQKFLEDKKSEGEIKNLKIYVQHTPEIIQTAHCCLSVSGSVSLELLANGVPTVISYRVSRFAWYFQKFLRRSKYITLVNLLAVPNPFRSLNPEYHPNGPDAKEVIFPEYLSCLDRSGWIADDLLKWLKDQTLHQQCVQRLEKMREEIGQPGAARNAAEKILENIKLQES